MLKIVLAYDASPQAKKAINCLTWWPANDIDVLLLTVVKCGPSLNEYGDGVECDPHEISRAEAILSQLQVDLLKLGIKSNSLVVTGDPRDAIIEVAQSKAADLILTGSRGLNLAKRMLLGSVSTDVLQNAPCPVLLVR